MAHNIELLIGQKVKEADSFPVAWRKNLVWQQVSRPANRKSRKLSYYAAAAVLMVGLTTLYFVLLHQQEISGDRILSLELAIKNKLELINSFQRAAARKESICDPVNRAVAATKQNHRDSFSKMKKMENIPSVEPSVVIPVAEIISPEATTQAHAESTDQTPVTAVEVAPETGLVNPIIGYIPAQRTMTVASKKIKKSKIRFLKSPEPELASQVVESKWTIARIN